MNSIKILKRNLSLSKLGIGELSTIEQKMYDFLINNLTNLNIYTCSDYPGILFIGKSEESIILQYSINDKFLSASINKIWNFFENELGMSDGDIANCMISCVNKILNTNVSNISYSTQVMDFLYEGKLKFEKRIEAEWI